MGVGADVTASGSSSTWLREPAFGEHVDYPELEHQERRTEECSADRFARRIRLPGLLLLALLEAVWIAALAYAVGRVV